jgi:hypothetical protein
MVTQRILVGIILAGLLGPDLTFQELLWESALIEPINGFSARPLLR